MEEVWLVESNTRCVQVWQRTGGSDWSGAFPFIGRASFTSLVLGVEVRLDEIYALTDLEELSEAGGDYDLVFEALGDAERESADAGDASVREPSIAN